MCRLASETESWKGVSNNAPSFSSEGNEYCLGMFVWNFIHVVDSILACSVKNVCEFEFLSDFRTVDLEWLCSIENLWYLELASLNWSVWRELFAFFNNEWLCCHNSFLIKNWIILFWSYEIWMILRTYWLDMSLFRRFCYNHSYQCSNIQIKKVVLMKLIALNTVHDWKENSWLIIMSLIIFSIFTTTGNHQIIS